MYHPALLQSGTPLSVAVRVRDPMGFAPRLRVLADAVDPTMQLTDVRLLSDVGGRGAQLAWAVTYAVGLVSLLVLLLSASGILRARIPADCHRHPRRQRAGGAEDRLRIPHAGDLPDWGRRHHADRGACGVRVATQACADDQPDGRLRAEA
jgi:hypothetical protein